MPQQQQQQQQQEMEGRQPKERQQKWALRL
jgi:hypothetical protein